jgi:putative adhesin
MMSLSRRALTLALPILALSSFSAGCDVVTADMKSSATDEWRKTYTLDPGGRVEINNVNGRIRVEPSEGNQVQIVAVKKAKGASEEAARQVLSAIEIREQISGGSVRVDTKSPRSNGLFGGSAEVAYSVRVPAGAEVRFTTVNGAIDMSRLSNRIKAETTNGGITARDVSGAIEATTTNGGLDVDVTRVAEGGVTLGCTNGGIKLQLPADAAATISASVANGGVETYGLTLDKSEATRRSLEARLNGGGPRIKLEGTNGGIRLSAR